jgi:hypothetical protein
MLVDPARHEVLNQLSEMNLVVVVTVATQILVKSINYPFRIDVLFNLPRILEIPSQSHPE